jgi:hypothetical protein
LHNRHKSLDSIRGSILLRIVSNAKKWQNSLLVCVHMFHSLSLRTSQRYSTTNSTSIARLEANGFSFLRNVSSVSIHVTELAGSMQCKFVLGKSLLPGNQSRKPHKPH